MTLFEDDVNEDKYALFIFWIKARISLDLCFHQFECDCCTRKKNSPVVITNHSWVHLSRRSIKITPRMSGLCGPADCCLLQQQVERHVFFMLMQPSCSKAGPEWKFGFYKINPFRKLKTYLSWFGIFTYGGLVGHGQLGRIVIHIKDPDTDQRLGRHGVVICRTDPREILKKTMKLTVKYHS